MAEPLIQLVNVHKRYGSGEAETHALKGVNLSIASGEFVALMGPSGSGKSTLMHIMGFLDQVTEGTYLFKGKDVSRLSDDELAHKRREDVGFVFQAFHLLAKSKMIDNVILPMLYSGVPHAERRGRAEKALTAVGLAHRLDHYSNQLSGGERQRVAIARALVNDPSIIFADEPTGNLDTKSGTDVLNLLQSLHEQGHTIIMVTHETEAAEFAERIVRVRDGQILSDSRDHARRSGSYTK